MADDQVVQDIALRGADEAIRQLQDIGRAGEEAFQRLRDAAQRAGFIGDGIDAAAKSAQQLQDQLAKTDAGKFAQQLKDTERAGRDLGGALRNAGGAVGSFLGSIGKVAGVTALAAAGMGALIATAFRSSQAQQAAAAAAERNLSIEQRANNLASMATLAHADSVATLQRAFALQQKNYLEDAKLAGTSDEQIRADQKKALRDYNDQLNNLNITRQQELRNQRLMQAAREDEAKATTKASVALAERQRIEALELQFGPALTTSLLGLGRVLQSVRQAFLSTFGPVISNFINGIGNAINENRNKIVGFFDAIAVSVERAFSGVSIEGFTNGLIAFGAQAVAIFTGIIVPAIRGVLAVLDLVAKGVNGIFGTNFTGPGLVAIALIAQLTGGFKLFGAAISVATTGFNALKIAFGGPWAVLIVLALTAVVFLLSQVDWAAVKVQVEAAWKAISDAVGKARDDIAARWETIKKFFSDLWTTITGFFSDAAIKITEITDRVKNTIIDIWTAIKEKAMKFLQPIFDFFVSLMSFADRVLDKVRQASDEAKAVGAGTSPGLAGGGHVRGRGTSTSDSIPAWLSNNEYVIRARAVSKYGVGLMHAINQLKFPSNAFRGFSAGGLVDGLMANFNPRVPLMMARGGPVPGPSGRPMTLVIDGETFRGLVAPDDVADKLEHFALKRRTRRAGRAPGWVGGR